MAHHTSGSDNGGDRGGDRVAPVAAPKDNFDRVALLDNHAKVALKYKHQKQAPAMRGIPLSSILTTAIFLRQ